jgi:cyclopropane-fatty-acyl-phospholipid synthase
MPQAGTFRSATPVTVDEREVLGIPVIRQPVFEQDYANRLAIRRNNFRAAPPNLMPSDFDDRFRRRCEDDIADCEAGFLPGNIRVRQMVFAKLSSFALHNA